MLLTKKLWADFNGELEPLVYANVYLSDAIGKIVPDGYLGETDINGNFNFDTSIVGSYVAVSWQSQVTVFTYTEFKNSSELFVPINENELDEVVITPEDDENNSGPTKNNSILYLLIGLIALKSFT